MKYLLMAVVAIFLTNTGHTQNKGNGRSIVLLTTAKTHGPGEHEHTRNARLIKTMLEHSNVKNLRVSIYEVWPADTSVLDKADLIMTLSDGRDGDSEFMPQVPFMTPERMRIMEKQMKRGCGFITFHFSTFAPDNYGEQVKEWGGGYFDWQDEQGKRNWYSAIKTITASLDLPSPTHPICTGVKPFQLEEEFYYNIRFNDNDKRLVHVASVPALQGNPGTGNTVAWAVQRQDGGRGFGTTMGHCYNNWKNEDFRTLLLNGIVWAAGASIPRGGVKARYYDAKEVTRYLFGKKANVLILTGNHHPAHPWKETTTLIKNALEQGSSFHVDVSTTIHDLYQYDLEQYDLLVMNYANWENPAPLHDSAKARTIRYLQHGGGMLILHFANGAFHFSMPGGAAADWPEYRNIVRRVWDHSAGSVHEPYGKFEVKVTSISHPATRGIRNFETTDELYYNQKGDQPIEPLLTAYSKTTAKQEPLAWAYNYGKGRIFQTLLGHDAASYQSPAFRQLLKQSAEWIAGLAK